MADQQHRPAAAYVHGLDGPAVVVPARVAAWLERHAGLRALRTSIRGADPEVDSVLVALAVAGAHWRTRRGMATDTGTARALGPEPGASSALTTTQAADLLGISDRGVRAAAAAGRLRAIRIAGRWQIDREDAEHYRATRAA